MRRIELPLGTVGMKKMNEFIRKDTAIAIVRAYLIENQITDGDWHSDGIAREIRDSTPADVRPLEDIASGVEEAIRHLESTREYRLIDYGSYLHLRDAIYAIKRKKRR